RSCTPRETRKIKELVTPNGKVTREIVYRDWQVLGTVHAWDPVEIVVNDLGRIIFGTCACEFFKENLLNKGPCEHMLALLHARRTQRQDLPTSVEAPNSGAKTPRDPQKLIAPDEALDEDEGKEDNHAS